MRRAPPPPSWPARSTRRASRSASCWTVTCGACSTAPLPSPSAGVAAGTVTAKVAEGLLADTQTRVLFRQSTDQIAQARALLGLTESEAELLPRLAKGRALWRIAGHAAVVAHVIGPDERHLIDTDANLL